MGTLPEMIGHRLRERRLELGLLPSVFGAQVGEYLGKPWQRQTVWLIEEGKRPLDANELIAVAIVLDYPVTYLLAPYPELFKGDEEIVLSTDWVMTYDELRLHVFGRVGLEAEKALTRRMREAQAEVDRLTDRMTEKFRQDMERLARLSAPPRKEKS